MKARRSVLAVVLFAGLAAMPAMAGPMIDWDPALFFEPNATPWASIATNEMQIVGTISAFGPPLADLNANIPAREYTFWVHGLISTGTAPVPPFYITSYNGGLIEVWEDATPDTSFGTYPPNSTVPSTFTNGVLLLSGTMSGFSTQTNTITPHQTGNAEGTITWTGGSRLGDVSGCPGLFTGALSWNGALLPQGYLFYHDGKIDYGCATPTKADTWGRIKSIYR